MNDYGNIYESDVCYHYAPDREAVPVSKTITERAAGAKSSDEVAVKRLEPKAHIGWYSPSKQCAVFGDAKGIEWAGPMLSGWHDNDADAWSDAAASLPSRWINVLPEYQRKYIHEIETQCDHTGTLQSLAYITEQRDALARRVEELEVVPVPPSAEQVKKLIYCLAFFASVIKCGEPWTDTCQHEYEESLEPWRTR